jgi:hypothetical protein
MPFDGASWKRRDEDPERPPFERRGQWLSRLLRIAVGVTMFGAFVLILWN